MQNKDKIWDAKLTGLITEANDIESVAVIINATTKTQLDVKIKVTAGKSYNQNWYPTTKSTETSFIITHFRTFGPLELASQEIQVKDLGSDTNKTGMENKDSITPQMILTKKDVIWKSEGTGLTTSASDINIENIQIINRQKTKLSITINVNANKFYDQDGWSSLQSKRFSAVFAGFKDFGIFNTTVITDMNITASSLVFASNDIPRDVLSKSENTWKIY